MPLYGSGRVEIDFVERPPRPVQEVLAVQLLALLGGVRVTGVDGLVELDSLRPFVRVVVAQAGPAGVAVERAPDAGVIHGLAEPTFAVIVGALRAVPAEVDDLDACRVEHDERWVDSLHLGD